jgi:Cys-tRNA(Pro)/Cys-tRNA(Cys) deacylase
MMKTNAVRVLDRLGIEYELREYDVSPDDLSAGTVAAKIGLPPDQVFKTLAAQGDRSGICLAVISANQELNFKALANQTGNRKIDLVPVKEVQALTGYIRGGVTALACKKDYPGIYRRACGNLRRDLGVGRHTRPADFAGSCRLHPSGQGHGRSYRKGEVTWPLSEIGRLTCFSAMCPPLLNLVCCIPRSQT